MSLTVKHCSFKGCKGNSNTAAVFRWPANEDIREKWKTFVKSYGTDVKHFNFMNLCDTHFDPEDIKYYKTHTRLKPGAVPKYQCRKKVFIKSFLIFIFHLH